MVIGETRKEAVESILSIPNRDLMEESEMLGDENRNFAEHLKKLGYSDSSISNIANGCNLSDRDCENCKYYNTMGEEENDLCTNPTSCADNVTCDYGCKLFEQREV